MNDKPLPRVIFGMKEIMTVLGIVFLAGGGWVILDVQGDQLDKVEVIVDGDHEKVIKLESSVENMVEDINEIKDEQKAMVKEQIALRIEQKAMVDTQTAHGFVLDKIYMEITK